MGISSDAKQLRKEARKATRRDARRSGVADTAVLECRGRIHGVHPMLLITAATRSHGMLLNRLFDSHPACFTYPGELEWDPQGVSPASDFPLSFAATRASAPSCPFVFDRHLAAGILADRSSRREGGHGQRERLADGLTAFFNAWLDYQNLYATPKRWVTAIEAPVIDRQDRARQFFADCPDGRLVTIVPHPVASMVDRVADDPPDDVEAPLAPWTASTGAALAAAAEHGDRVIVMLFEDLINRTTETMRALCGRLGIAFDPVLLEPTFNSLSLPDARTALDTWRAPRARVAPERGPGLDRARLLYDAATQAALIPHD